MENKSLDEMLEEIKFEGEAREIDEIETLLAVIEALRKQRDRFLHDSSWQDAPMKLQCDKELANILRGSNDTKD